MRDDPQQLWEGENIVWSEVWIGRWANTSSLGNGFTRVARIKQGEDGVLLSKREGSDHGGG